MLYSPPELAEDLHIPAHIVREWLNKGLPYRRDAAHHVWINGREVAARGSRCASTRASAPDRVLHRCAGTPRAVRRENLGRPDAHVIAFIQLGHVQPFVINLLREVSIGTLIAGLRQIHAECFLPKSSK
jgi:hypothetical protein